MQTRVTAPPHPAPAPRTAAPAPARRRGRLASLASDPRHFQILALSGLLAYGLVELEFGLGPAQVAVVLAGALATQWLGHRAVAAGAPDLRSPLISALSLCLLLRVDDLALAGAAAVLAIGSKFVLRVRARHVFNPTALAIAAMVLGFDGAWVSPGQWGRSAAAGLLVAGVGLLVLTRARRMDVMLAFLSSWSLALLARAAWYGDPLSVPLHQLANGAVLLFAFFMITDPRTTPEARSARLVFAVAVAVTAACIGFGLHRSDALVLALAACGPLCPLLDALLPPARARSTRPVHSHPRRTS